MYTKDQVSQLKQAFWTAFGQYISPHPSAEGLKINWINYKTGFKHLHFRMQADHRSATISIEMSHPDVDIQALMFEQFLAFKNILKDTLNGDWEWQLHGQNEYGKTVSSIYSMLPNVSVLKQEDWPAMISFFKPRIIALDEFWSDAQYSFELFR